MPFAYLVVPKEEPGTKLTGTFLKNNVNEIMGNVCKLATCLMCILATDDNPW
jgi:hypothetical protein